MSLDQERETEQLTMELQMIESTIREREDEITYNHRMIAAPHANGIAVTSQGECNSGLSA
jgi:hypothetical protein